MKKQSLQIHSENILPIIKKWLYSDRDIFVRELVSNACDAIYKTKILRDKGEVVVEDSEFRIDVYTDSKNKTLKFVDNGIGMTAEEVEKYIAQIAFSGAEEFLDKYKSDKAEEQVIGHFGLGFYSAYMVASKVEINTLSYKPNSEPVFWSCDGSSQYEIDKGTKEKRGTEIILFIDNDHGEYLEDHKLNEILHHYCDFLPYPIYLNGKKINIKEPLWIKNPSDCTKENYLEFYRHLYPLEEEPLFWIHLNVDYPFHLKGVLYFPKIHRNFDINKSSVKLYCNRVFVSDNCKDVIPNYLMPLRGIIDSPDIPLNVSRSYLQMDKTVRQLASHISKKVADSLTTLYRTEKDRYITCWEDIAAVIKLGALEDEKFYEKVKDLLIWKDIQGNWLTAENYLEQNKDKNKILYTKDDKHSLFIDLYRKKNINVLIANSFIDPYLMAFLEKKLTPATFQRIDSTVDESLIDKEKEKTLLNAEGKTESTLLADFFRSKLAHRQVEIEAKSLATDSISGLIVIDENERRMREYMHSLDPSHAAKMPEEKRTFVINTNNPLINTLEKLDKVNPSLAKEIVEQVYDISLLAQREMDPALLNEFVSRNLKVLNQLSKAFLDK